MYAMGTMSEVAMLGGWYELALASRVGVEKGGGEVEVIQKHSIQTRHAFK